MLIVLAVFECGNPGLPITVK